MKQKQFSKINYIYTLRRSSLEAKKRDLEAQRNELIRKEDDTNVRISDLRNN